MRAENIFLDAEGHVAVSDFLLRLPGKFIPPAMESPEEYFTPEHILGAEESSASDWWRFGVLLYELLAGLPPFRRRKDEDSAALREKIRTHTPETLRFPPCVSPNAVDLIKKVGLSLWHSFLELTARLPLLRAAPAP
jgi:serine/threonine protein kinase